VDIWHAREHLHHLAATVAFIVTDPDQWLADRLADLDAGNIEAIIAAAEEYPMVGVKATDRDQALTYFKTNTVRMRYARHRDLGRFLGSGTVEAGWLQGRHRPAPHTLRPALDPTRRHRHPHPALPTSQRPLGPDPDTTGQPDPGHRPRLRNLIMVTYKSVAHPRPGPGVVTVGGAAYR